MKRGPHKFKNQKKQSPKKSRSRDFQPKPNLKLDQIVYGKNPVEEVLAVGKRTIHEIFISKTFVSQQANQGLLNLIQKNKIPTTFKDNFELADLIGGGVHQGIVAKVDPFQYGNWDGVIRQDQEKDLVLMLDQVQDPQNFGTLCRGALSLGVKNIILPKDNSVSITPTVFKASAGAIERLNIVLVTNLVRTIEDFQKNGYWVYGTHLSEKTVSLTQVKPAEKSVIVMGSEGKGLRRLVAERCDQLVKIPMPGGFESLNVAQAGTIVLYEFSKQIFSES